MSQQLSAAQAKKLTLDRLNQWIKELPVSERQRPRIMIDFKSYSVLDLKAEVERDTEVGVRYVYDTAKRLGYVVE